LTLFLKSKDLVIKLIISLEHHTIHGKITTASGFSAILLQLLSLSGNKGGRRKEIEQRGTKKGNRGCVHKLAQSNPGSSDNPVLHKVYERTRTLSQ